MSKKEDTPIPAFDYIRWEPPVDVRAPDNRRKTQALFFETIQKTQHEKYPAVYTLKETEEWDWRHEKWLPSAKQIYIASDSEYEAAKKLVGSIEHWNMLLENDWFVEGFNPQDYKPYAWTSLKQWRQEQEMRKIAIAQTVLMSQAMQGDTNAAKFLILGPKKVGRPDKVTPEMKERYEKEKEVNVKKDHERILSLVKH
jgi:hypothetical protein